MGEIIPFRTGRRRRARKAPEQMADAVATATAVFLVTTTMVWLAFAAAVGEFWLRMRIDTNEEA
jgi:hypothetical protein